jgi:hypothetical protein
MLTEVVLQAGRLKVRLEGQPDRPDAAGVGDEDPAERPGDAPPPAT